jgi:thioredoxin 1
VERISSATSLTGPCPYRSKENAVSDAIILTADNFEQEVVNSDLPIVVDLWAPWCGPCRAAAPVLDKLAKEYDGRVKVAKVNVDEEIELAQAFNVSSIPMFVALKGRDVQDVAIGFGGESGLRKLFEKLV